MYKRSKKHQCTLNLGSDSMLPKTGGKGGLCHMIRKLTLIGVHHPSTKKHFISYPAVVAERQRQLAEGGAWVIHPFSQFSLIWCSFMLIINLIFIQAAPMRLCYILPKDVPTHGHLDYLLISLKFAILLDIFIKFNMGYRDKNETYIVMVRRRIALHYLKHWFVVDLLSAVPSGFLVPYLGPNKRYHLLMRSLACVRCLKICLILTDYKTLVEAFNLKVFVRRMVRLQMMFMIALNWCSCLVYLAPIINYYWTGKPPQGYCKFLEAAKGDFSKTRALYRYKKAVYISCAAFFGTAFTTFSAKNPDEMITNSIIVITGTMYMLYAVTLLLKLFLTQNNSITRYQELMSQVEKYMQYKQFPVQMRNRVREFYRYRYQERYFRESLALKCMSERLRNEIFLDTCHKLIEKVALFEGFPASVVGSVLGCLHAEVYLPNDLVARAGDIGECMYFIACGTVAVYSMKGAEVCHLDDGAHFGEVALLMKDRKRIATVVAIEITQLYRLDHNDFRDFIMSYHELYLRVEELATRRMHETTLIDEAYKQI